MSQIKLWAVIPAAGSGTRFSKTELKQYQLIHNKTVLEHTVERLNLLPLAGYVLAIGEQDDVAKSLDLVQKQKLHFCIGGAERVHSVLNALHYLSAIASDDDYVLVHDAARPCVMLESLEQLIKHCVQSNRSAILAIPVRDTLKLTQHKQIQKTLSRDDVWQAQTPQMAKLGTLRTCIEKALLDQVDLTDEASALEYAGEQVDVVQGRSDNIKVTYLDDLALARCILNAQNHLA